MMKNQRKQIIFFLTFITFSFMIHAQQASVDDSYFPSPVDVPGKGKILIITDNKTNDTELFYPLYRFVEEGYQVTIATLAGGEIAGYNSASIKSTVPVSTINPADYKGLYLPGGKAPAKLREHDEVIQIVNHFIETGKPIAAICHGPQLLVKTGVVKGKSVTSWPGMQDELKEAGGTFIDQPVVVDGNIITARMPGDLPPHVHTFLQMLQ